MSDAPHTDFQWGSCSRGGGLAGPREGEREVRCLFPAALGWQSHVKLSGIPFHTRLLPLPLGPGEVKAPSQ